MRDPTDLDLGSLHRSFSRNRVSSEILASHLQIHSLIIMDQMDGFLLARVSVSRRPRWRSPVRTTSSMHERRPRKGRRNG